MLIKIAAMIAHEFMNEYRKLEEEEPDQFVINLDKASHEEIASQDDDPLLDGIPFGFSVPSVRPSDPRRRVCITSPVSS